MLWRNTMLLCCGEGALGDQPKIAIEAMAGWSKGREAVMVREGGHLGRFDGLNIKMGGLLPVEALLKSVSHQFSMPNWMICSTPFFSDKVQPEAAFEHKIIRLADLLLFQQEFFFLHFPELQPSRRVQAASRSSRQYIF
jgi:hypothetical protein